MELLDLLRDTTNYSWGRKTQVHGKRRRKKCFFFFKDEKIHK